MACKFGGYPGAANSKPRRGHAERKSTVANKNSQAVEAARRILDCVRECLCECQHDDLPAVQTIVELIEDEVNPVVYPERLKRSVRCYLQALDNPASTDALKRLALKDLQDAAKENGLLTVY
jgi:hypothetical protein